MRYVNKIGVLIMSLANKVLFPIFSLIVVIFLFGCTESEPQETTKKSKLVLQITVDQLRGDMPTAQLARLGEGGFRYLLDNGINYTNAHHRHANTETAVGHATLFTGADPSVHGLVGNSWIDPHTGAYVYNTEDGEHHIVGKEAKAHEGISPNNLLVSTIGDELIDSNDSLSRVFSVSIKDRGAIIPGGHKGKAFWYSKSSGDFVTSSYYYDNNPSWLTEWNSKKLADSYSGKSWELFSDLASYDARDRDDRPYEANLPPLGRVFPHQYGSDKYLYLILSLTPAGDELTLDFAKKLIDSEAVGQGNEVDFLAVSFSSTDYVGHMFGPASLESEDNILRLDNILKQLFSFVDEKVGLENTLIVLSADHGAPEAPEYSDSIGREAGRFDFTYFREQGPLNEALTAKYGRDDLIATHSHPYLYLNLAAIAEAGLKVAEVEQFVADEVIKILGISHAFIKSNLLAGIGVDSPLGQQVARNFHPVRSGNIHMVQEPYWFLHSTDEAQKMGLDAIAAIHGSPWEYDTHVPIMIARKGMASKSISRLVSPVDIAPTIAEYLQIDYPSGVVGEPLKELVEGN